MNSTNATPSRSRVSRLIDDLRSANRIEAPPFVAPAKYRSWVEHMTRCSTIIHDEQLPVILCDNVSSYYFEGTGKEQWNLIRDFPNVAPPYPIAWFEHRFPKQIVSDERGNTNVEALTPKGRVGWIVIGANREDVVGENIPGGARWILAAEQFIDYGTGKFYGSPGTITIAVDEYGRVMEAPSMMAFCGPEAYAIMRALMTWLHPILLTLSFMHCKNVEVVENEVPAKLAKKYRARHGISPTRYKTLVIEPLKAILRREGKSDANGLPKALHICRGHFKDYRDGRGLFGKHKALVWFDQTLRGTKGEKAPAREVEVRINA